jgi:hypothetical protein
MFLMIIPYKEIAEMLPLVQEQQNQILPEP